jgi:hypothetical protein
MRYAFSVTGASTRATSVVPCTMTADEGQEETLSYVSDYLLSC